MALASGGCMVGHSATRGRGRGRGGGDKRLLPCMHSLAGCRRQKGKWSAGSLGIPSQIYGLTVVAHQFPLASSLSSCGAAPVIEHDDETTTTHKSAMTTN
jgi:hypothetical protein